jgi:hypothetical protein
LLGCLLPVRNSSLFTRMIVGADSAGNQVVISQWRTVSFLKTLPFRSLGTTGLVFFARSVPLSIWTDPSRIRRL